MMKKIQSFALISLNFLMLLLLVSCTTLAASPPATEPIPTSSPPAMATATVEVRPSPSPTLPAAQPSLTPSPAPTRTPAVTATPGVTATPPLTLTIEHVVIISIDGLRPDALELADTPVLDALRRAGAYHPQAQSVLPSVTLVNHASMLGGMSPDKHGISWNENKPDLGKVNGPTLFSVAHEAGFSTGMVVGKPKLEHLVLPGSVDQYIYAGFTDSQVVDKALLVIREGLPDLFFMHLPDVDSAGHLTGWMMPGQILTIGLTDSLVGEVITALDEEGYLDKSLLIITADHGGSGFAHGSDSPEDMTIPWLAVGPGVPAGIVLSGTITSYDTAATALFALDLPIPERWDGQPVKEIFSR